MGEIKGDDAGGFVGDSFLLVLLSIFACQQTLLL